MKQFNSVKVGTLRQGDTICIFRKRPLTAIELKRGQKESALVPVTFILKWENTECFETVDGKRYLIIYYLDKNTGVRHRIEKEYSEMIQASCFRKRY